MNRGLTYDEENRLTGISGSITASFVYDGQGARVKRVVDEQTTAYAGNWFEWHNDGNSTSSISYYFLGGVRVAMRNDDDVSFLHGDNLGSIKRTTNAIESGPQRDYPYGTHRGVNEVETDHGFTGQYEEADLGLYYYNARWYDPYVGRFIQPDAQAYLGGPRVLGFAEPGNRQSLNRYASDSTFAWPSATWYNSRAWG